MSRETPEGAAYRQREELRDEVRELRKAVEVLTGLLYWANHGLKEGDTGQSLFYRGVRFAKNEREALDE